MRFNLEVVLSIEGTIVKQAGVFQARNKADIPNWARKWIREIKMNTGYRETEVVSVILNGEEDITQEVNYPLQ